MTYKEAFQQWVTIKFTLWAMEYAVLYGADYAHKHCNAENFLKEHPAEDLWQEFISAVKKCEDAGQDQISMEDLF